MSARFFLKIQIMSKILAFSGSSRKNSYNSQLVKIAAAGASSAGASVTVIDLADFPMPIYEQDLETAQGLPDNARKFKQLLIEHDGLLIASPEYNSAFSPLLKNVLDWASRTESPDEKPMLAYQGKYCAIMAASPGGLGGMRGLVFLRMLMGNLGVTVLPAQQAVGSVFKAFDADGSLLDKKQDLAVRALGSQLHEVLQRMGR
jgi:NAD(P)H-dependent FMN reductase